MIPDFTDPERWKQLESGAYSGLLDISEYPAAEYRFFSRFVALGKAYRTGEITLEEAGRRKRLLLAEYREDAARAKKADEVYFDRARDIRISEDFRVKIIGSDDVHEIASLACRALALLTGDIMLARVAEKLDNDTDRTTKGE